jgi:hypothetical protein
VFVFFLGKTLKKPTVTGACLFFPDIKVKRLGLHFLAERIIPNVIQGFKCHEGSFLFFTASVRRFTTVANDRGT